MRAEVGDELTVRGVHQGDEDRHGEIIRVDGDEVTHHPASRAG